MLDNKLKGLGCFVFTVALAACGGGSDGGGGSGQTPSAQTPSAPTRSANVFIGLNGSDDYIGTVFTEDASFSFYEDATGNKLYEQVVVYQSKSSSVLFAQSAKSANMDLIQIDDYEFDFLSNTDGTSVITVTKPDDSQESYYFNTNNQLEDAEPIEPSDGGSCAIHASTLGEATDFCFSNYRSYFPSSYCTVAMLEKEQDPTGGVTFISANFSATQTCAEQGFPYYGANDVWFNEKELADTMREAQGSINQQLSIAKNRTVEETCVDLDSSDASQVKQCIDNGVQSILNALPIDTKFTKVLDAVIKKDFSSLENELSLAMTFADEISTLLESKDNQLVAALGEFATSVLDDHSIDSNINQLLASIKEFFEDFENDSLEESYPGLGSLNDIFRKDGKRIIEEDEPVAPSERKTECTLTEGELAEPDSTFKRLECTTTINGYVVVASRDELIENFPASYDFISYTIGTGDFEFEEYEPGNYVKSAKVTNYLQVQISELYKKRNRSYSSEKWDIGDKIVQTEEIHNSAYYTFTTNHAANHVNALSVMASKNFANYSTSIPIGTQESCHYHPNTDSELSIYKYNELAADGGWKQMVNDKRVCPFSLELEEDMTKVINDLDENDMWLLTGEYEKYLVD